MTDMTDKTIKNIILDLGGVIIDVDMKRCFMEIEKLGVPVKEMMSGNKGGAVVCEGISVSGPMELYQQGNISSDDFFNGLLSLCREGTTREEAEAAWNSCLLSIPQERLDAILELRKKYNVYLLSNTNDCHWQLIEKEYFSAPHPTTDKYFDKVFLSHEMHLAKPDVAIFERVLEEIGAKGEECLFVDDAALNLEAAAKCGIKTLQAVNGLPDFEGRA